MRANEVHIVTDTLRLERVTGPTWTQHAGIFGGWYAIDASGNLLVRRDYKLGDLPPRFRTGEAAIEAAPRMFVRHFDDDPATTQSRQSMRDAVDAMAPIDCFDYLADYAQELRNASPDELRAAVLRDAEQVGPAVFFARIA